MGLNNIFDYRFVTPESKDTDKKAFLYCIVGKRLSVKDSFGFDICKVKIKPGFNIEVVYSGDPIPEFQENNDSLNLNSLYNYFAFSSPRDIRIDEESVEQQ